MLKVLLGPWCLAGGRAMAAPLAVLLRAGGSLAQAVLASRGALALLASEAFLGASGEALAPGEPLALLADAGALEVIYSCTAWGWLQGPSDLKRLLGDEVLMPLIQIPGVKQELRHPRFRDAMLADALEPFPVLFDDLLKAWFKAPEPVDPPEPPAMPEQKMPPSELASWASCERFRRHGYLHAHLAAASPMDLMEFARQAALEDPSVADAVKMQLGKLSWAAYRSLPDWPTLVATVLSDHSFLRRLWMCQVIGPRLLARLVTAVSFPAILGPFRIFAALQGWHSRGSARGAGVSPRHDGNAWSWRTLLFCFARYLSVEIHGMRGAITSIASVMTLALNLSLASLKNRHSQRQQRQLSS